MGYDLRRGLGSMTTRAPLPDEPVSPERVLARVRRGRLVRATGMTSVAAAAVLATALVVQAAPWQDDPVPPADPSPTAATPEPTATPDGEPVPGPVPEPTPSPEPTEPEPETTAGPAAPTGPVPAIVALTDAGDLVEVDPSTGATSRVLVPGLVDRPEDGGAAGTDLAVTTDRSAAYLHAGPWNDLRIVRVDLATGATETVAESGSQPAVSPDGSTLAFIEKGVRDGTASTGLTLLDLASGERHHVPDAEYCECDRYVVDPVWSPDGSTVLVTYGFGDGALSTNVVEVDVASPPEDLNDDADLLVFEGSADRDEAEWRPEYLDDGRVVLVRRPSYLLGADQWWRFVVRSPDGSTTQSPRFTTEPPWTVVAEPDGDTVLLERPVWDEDGTTVSGSVTRVALDGERLWHVDGLTAVAW